MEAEPRASDLESLRLFDSCVTLGRIVHSGYPVSLTADSLLELMDRYAIADALVHEHHARNRYPREEGNARVCEAVRGRPRLHPVWVMEPPREPGSLSARRAVARAIDAGVRAVRLPMQTIPPLAWLWDDFLAELEARHVPCFLDFGGVSTWGDLDDGDVDGVRTLALAHPGLALVLSNVVGGLGIHPGILPLVRRTPNVLVDTTGVLEFWREAAAVDPGRVLFATGMPFTDPGIYVSNVQYARGLDEEAKRLICGGRLRALLEAVR